MNKNVYISDLVYFSGDKLSHHPDCLVIEEACLQAAQDSYADKISRMCITGIDLLRKRRRQENFCHFPIYFGSRFGPLKSVHDFDKTCVVNGALYAKPGLFPNTVLNAPACRAGIAHQITGPVYNVFNGISASLDAIGLAYMALHNGLFCEGIVSSAEEYSPLQSCTVAPEIIYVESFGALLLTNQKTYGYEIIGYEKRGYGDSPKETLIEMIVKYHLEQYCGVSVHFANPLKGQTSLFLGDADRSSVHFHFTDIDYGGAGGFSAVNSLKESCRLAEKRQNTLDFIVNLCSGYLSVLALRYVWQEEKNKRKEKEALADA